MGSISALLSNPRARALGVLMAVLALLVTVLVVTREETAEPPARVGRLYTATTETVQTIIIGVGNDAPVALERAEDHWQVVSPVVTRADEQAVGAIADVIGSILGAPLFRLEDADPAQFGLVGGDAVEMALVDGSGREDRIVFGSVIPLDVGFVYTLNPRTGMVYKVFKDIKTVIDRDLYALRSKHFLHLATAEIEAIEIDLFGMADSAAPTIHLRREGLWWEMEQPLDTAADTQRVQELIQTIARLQAAEFLPAAEGTAAGAAAAFSPRAQLRFVDAAGNAETVVFGDGGAASVPHSLARSDTTAGLGRVAATELLGLPLTVDRLVAATPLRFDPRDIVSIAVRGAEESGTVAHGATTSILLTRDEQGWLMSSPRDERADADAVALALQDLMRIEITALDDADATDAAGNVIEFELGALDGAVHRLRVVPPDGSRTFALARSSFQAQPFALAAEFFARLPRTTLAFEDRRMLRFDSRDVVAFDLRTPDGDMRIEKRANEWAVALPRRGIAEQPIVWGLIFGVQDVTQIGTIAADSVRGRAAQLRLESSEATRITLWATGGVQLGTLTFVGTADPEQMYVQSSTRPGIFVADRAQFTRVAVSPQRLEFRR